jgi:hypothetical protein
MKRSVFALLFAISTPYAAEQLPAVDALLTHHGQELRNARFPEGLPETTEADIDALTSKLGLAAIPDQLRLFFLNFSHKVYPARTLVTPQARFHETAVGIIQAAWDTGVPKTHLPFCEDNSDYYCINLIDGSVGLWSHETKTFADDYYWESFVDWVQKDWAPLFEI